MSTRLTREQLIGLIREEKARRRYAKTNSRLRLVRESAMDTNLMQSIMGSFPEQMAGALGESMMELFWEEGAEESDTFRDTSEAQWEQEVQSAQDQLILELVDAIEKSVEKIEAMLHDGQFRRP
jgi:hypothetical protein